MHGAQVTFDARFSVRRLRREIAKVTRPHAVRILTFLQEQRIEFGVGYYLIVIVGSRVRRILGRARRLAPVRVGCGQIYCSRY